MTVLDRERLGSAEVRFAAFFRELSATYVERDDVLLQIAFALLSREHVLLCGPPGTAKSHLAGAVLNRIIDEASGRPSVFARQLTESTVQTDLIGPVDFKTLMASGRTEHFTDEGMLGAVHAFLDEVLDGRDMLLRATLNLLQERELKEGNRIKHGAIECALMTTNRYPAEVVEQSRETLLAFMDRIAYVGFVPRGFAVPEHLAQVLLQFVGGRRSAPLEARLTIQDLDALQAAVDAVYVSPELCERLAELARLLDTELAAAARADRTFVPTRYLSTRSAVRLGRTLRAAVVYARAMGASRALEARLEDFQLLRLGVLLCGPTPEQVAPLLERETDPRERRQLNIVRTEREIFDRCLKRLPPVDVRKQAVQPDVGALKRKLSAAEGRPEALSAVAREIAAATAIEVPGAEQLTAQLERSVDGMLRRALAAGMTAGTHDEADLDKAVQSLTDLATEVEKVSGAARPLARWIRGRAVELVAEQLAHAPTDLARVLEAATAEVTVAGAVAGADAVLKRAEQAWALRARLEAQGAAVDLARVEAAWERAAERLAATLSGLWDEGFRGAVASALDAVERGSLRALLDALAEPLARIADTGRRLAEVGGSPTALHDGVVGPRLAPLVAAAFQRFDARDRLDVIEQVEALLANLDGAGLGGVIAPARLLEWAAAALVATEPAADTVLAGLTYDHAGYRALRQREQRVSLTYTLIGVALRLRREPIDPTQGAEVAPAVVSELVGGLPGAVREQIVRLDLARLDRAIAFLEDWWEALTPPGAEVPDDVSAINAVLRVYVASRFFHSLMDEAILARFALEARLVTDVFPEAGPQTAALTARIGHLGSVTTGRLTVLFAKRSAQGWSHLLNGGD